MTIPLSIGLAAALCVGADAGSPIMDTEYHSPFRFTGTVKKALVDVSGEDIANKEAAAAAYLKVAMGRQ